MSLPTGASLLGRIALHYNLITPDQLAEATRAQGRLGNEQRLGEILVDLGHVSPAQLDWLLRAQAQVVEKQRQSQLTKASEAAAEAREATEPVGSMVRGLATPEARGTPLRTSAPAVAPARGRQPVPARAPVPAPGPAPGPAPAPVPARAPAPAPASASGLLELELAVPGPAASELELEAPRLELGGSATPDLDLDAPVAAPPLELDSAPGALLDLGGAGAPALLELGEPEPVADGAAAPAPLELDEPLPAPERRQDPPRAEPPLEGALAATTDGAAPRPASADRAPCPPPGERRLDKILVGALRYGASDVHVHAGAPVMLRVHGQLVASKAPPLAAEEAERMILEVLTDAQYDHLLGHRDLDFAYSLPGVGRFRASAYRQQRGFDAVFRAIGARPPTLDELGLPSTLARFTNFHQGLVLVTGPAGCGKSSTLAALVNLINEERRDHIITVEDPIEYLHPSKRCVVNQRQVVRHTESFARALRAALREDPDVIAIGELRDLETISLAITAAETGHLVLATLHTNNSIRTINRVLDAFPPEQQAQIRTMFSESLRAIVSQRLVPTADGARRVAALEVLVVTGAAANLIRDEKAFQIRSILQTGRSQGMCLLDDSLVELVKSGAISKEEARRHCDDPRTFAG